MPNCSSFHSCQSSRINMASPLLFLSCSLMLMTCVRSEIFTVGDANLWSDGSTYDLWSQKYAFHVGDVLEFKYTIGVHNVYEVTKATYQSCDASTGVLAKYESGDDKIELSKARPYWFLCNIEGHCLGGMRFGINVANATTTAFSPSQTGNNATTPPPPSSTNKAIRGRIDATCVLILMLIINITLGI